MRRLDPFGDGGHAQRSGHGDDTVYQGWAGIALGDRANERLVDLQPVERKLVQVRQRGLAGAEIIERQRCPRAAELMKNPARGREIADEYTLGELELQR